MKRERAIVVPTMTSTTEEEESQREATERAIRLMIPAARTVVLFFSLHSPSRREGRNVEVDPIIKGAPP
jgi:hypothetical protein